MKYYKQIENILMATGYIKQADRQKILNHINIARRGNKQLRDSNKLLKRENKELRQNKKVKEVNMNEKLYEELKEYCNCDLEEVENTIRYFKERLAEEKDCDYVTELQLLDEIAEYLSYLNGEKAKELLDRLNKIIGK